MRPTIACVVPCHNEETTVGKVVRDLRMALPEADIYVYDNASTDRTVEVARAAGAIVRREARKGKGNVIRRAFADVDADALLLIDGDDTYDASRARDLVNLLFEGPYDQVVGARRETVTDAYPVGHATGNRLLTGAVRSLFGNDVTDMLSGYRVFSRRFVKSFPALARQFETETEMTIHALHLRLPTAEVEVDYRGRPAGSESKLRTIRDGWRILRVILDLARRERPSLVHTVLAGVLAFVSVVLGIPVIADFVRTGTVPRIPTAILAAAIMTIAVLVLLVGYILESLMHMRQAHSRLVHLAYAAPGRRPLRYTAQRSGAGQEHRATLTDVCFPRRRQVSGRGGRARASPCRVCAFGWCGPRRTTRDDAHQYRPAPPPELIAALTEAHNSGHALLSPLPSPYP